MMRADRRDESDKEKESQRDADVQKKTKLEKIEKLRYESMQVRKRYKQERGMKEELNE